MKTFAIYAVPEDDYYCGKVCPFLYRQEDECGHMGCHCRLFGELHVNGDVNRDYECRMMEVRSRESRVAP